MTSGTVTCNFYSSSSSSNYFSNFIFLLLFFVFRSCPFKCQVTSATSGTPSCPPPAQSPRYRQLEWTSCLPTATSRQPTYAWCDVRLQLFASHRSVTSRKISIVWYQILLKHCLFSALRWSVKTPVTQTNTLFYNLCLQSFTWPLHVSTLLSLRLQETDTNISLRRKSVE